MDAQTTYRFEFHKEGEFHSVGELIGEPLTEIGDVPEEIKRIARNTRDVRTADFVRVLVGGVEQFSEGRNA